MPDDLEIDAVPERDEAELTCDDFASTVPSFTHLRSVEGDTPARSPAALIVNVSRSAANFLELMSAFFSRFGSLFTSRLIHG